MALTDRVKNILMQPRQEWEVVARESSSIAEIYQSYVLPLEAQLEARLEGLAPNPSLTHRLRWSPGLQR